MRQPFGEAEQRPGGDVAALRIGQDGADVQGGRRVGGVEVEHPDIAGVGLRLGGNEHRHPPVAPPPGGDVHDQSGGIARRGVLAPELGRQRLLLVGLEPSGVEVDGGALTHPDHEDVGLGGHDRVGPPCDMAEQGVDVVVEQLERRRHGVLEDRSHLLELRVEAGHLLGCASDGTGVAVDRSAVRDSAVVVGGRIDDRIGRSGLRFGLRPALVVVVQ